MTKIIVQATGGQRPEDRYETTPEDAARLLASAAHNERPGFAAEIAGLWHNGDLSAYEVTDEHQRTFLAAPEGSPHLAITPSPFEVVAEGVYDDEDDSLLLLSTEDLHDLAEEDAFIALPGALPNPAPATITVERWVVWSSRDNSGAVRPRLFETFDEAEAYRSRLAPAWHVSPVYAEV